VKNSLIPHTQKLIEAEIARTRGKRGVDPEHPKQRMAVTDQAGLLSLDPRQILTGTIEVYDDRDPRRR